MKKYPSFFTTRKAQSDAPIVSQNDEPVKEKPKKHSSHKKTAPVVKKTLIALLLAVYLVVLGGVVASFFYPVLNISRYVLFGLTIFIGVLAFYRIYQKVSLQKKEVAISALITIVVLGIVIGSSFIGMYFNGSHTLDVGAVKEQSDMLDALNPKDRVSEKKAEMIGDSVITYRELLSPSVYTSVKMPASAQYVNFTITFKNTLPKGNSMNIGFKDKDIWSYKMNRVFTAPINLAGYNQTSSHGVTLYMKNTSKQFDSVSDFLANASTSASILVDNKLLLQAPADIYYTASRTVVNSKVRGSFEMYIQANGTLSLKFVKMDLNMYDNEDIYNVSLYTFDNVYKESRIVNDDGIKNKSKDFKMQPWETKFDKLPLGIYRVVFSGNGDSSIENLTINQKNAVFTNSVHFLEPFKGYSGANEYSFSTYHKEGYQIIALGKQKINVSNVSTQFKASEKGTSEFTLPTGDIVVSAKKPFSVSKDNYFNPFKYNIVSINDVDLSKLSVDYYITNTQYTSNGNWVKASVVVPTEGLFLDKNKKLSVLLNAAHLSDKSLLKYTVPVDSIEVTFDAQ